LVAADQLANIKFEVTSVALTGVSPGTPVESSAVGPVLPANTAPTATSVAITGTVEVGQQLTGTYTYNDADSDAEGSSTYRWLRDTVAIFGATAQTYTLVAADQGTSIVFEVTPVALTGVSPGTAVASAAVGPVNSGGGGLITLEVRVVASSDDAEERVSGSVSLGSSDLEFVFDGGGDQTVGMRFNAVTIPPGANIVNAYVQFQVDEVNSVPTSLTIEGEATENATTFSGSSGNISSRSRTASFVSWDPAPWTTKGDAGPDQQTPDIASIIQEIVNRSGWSSGNSLVIIITGTGERTAESFNGDQNGASLLHVEYLL
jgi:hypothetical protein